MSDSNTPDYYRGREERERALAASAVSPAIAAVHAEMANRYAVLIAECDAAQNVRPFQR